MFEVIGMVAAGVSAWGCLLAAVYAMCIASNRITYMVLDAYGGWDTFLRYREWYHEQKKEANHE